MKLRWVCLFCAACAFIAVINLPIGYYTFLRIVLTAGALIVLIKGWRKTSFIWMTCFGLIAVLFNPIFPIYFGMKIIWMPIDIITGILFLIIDFEKDKDKQLKDVENENTSISIYSRDKIINAIHTKNENLK